MACPYTEVRMLRLGLLLSLLLYLPGTALAGDMCDYYRRAAPIIYKLVCTGGNRKAQTAGAYSTFSDAFNLNAGTLPSDPSTYGIEVIGSHIRGDLGLWSPNFALVKGFHRFGAGVSTASNNTFNGNDILRRIKGPPLPRSFDSPEESQGQVTSLNLGTSVRLFESRRGLSGKLGLSLRYNKLTDTVGGGPGLLFVHQWYVVGFGLTNEKVSNVLPRLYLGSFLLGARLKYLELEYTMLTDTSGLGLQPIHILTLSSRLGRFLGVAAVRHLNYLGYGHRVQPHFSIQLLLSRSLAVGALYNYIPGTNSLAFQYFF